MKKGKRKFRAISRCQLATEIHTYIHLFFSLRTRVTYLFHSSKRILRDLRRASFNRKITETVIDISTSQLDENWITKVLELSFCYRWLAISHLDDKMPIRKQRKIEINVTRSYRLHHRDNFWHPKFVARSKIGRIFYMCVCVANLDKYCSQNFR